MSVNTIIGTVNNANAYCNMRRYHKIIYILISLLKYYNKKNICRYVLIINTHLMKVKFYIPLYNIFCHETNQNVYDHFLRY